MRNIKIFIIIAVVASLCVSCKKNEKVAFGTVEYYPSFLWEKAQMTPVKKTFDFYFSQDAKNDPYSFAEFQFVDNNGQPISTSEMQVSIDGKQCANNKFRVSSGDKSSKVLTFTFSPNAEDGKHQGYLKLVNHKLDRLDSQPLKRGQKVDAFQWTLGFDKKWNPLALALTLIISFVILATLLWKIIFQSIFFKKFRAINKMVIIPNQPPISIHFRGARMVVIDKVMHKQSKWDKFWKGKIIYKQNPTITSPITLKPWNKGRSVRFYADSRNYACMPNPITQNPSKVNDIINRKQIIIQ